MHNRHEAESQVPRAGDDPLERIDRKIDELAAQMRALALAVDGYVMGAMNERSKRFVPGLEPRLTEAEKIIERLMTSRSWVRQAAAGVALAVVSAVCSAWAVTTALGPLPHAIEPPAHPGLPFPRAHGDKHP